MWSESLANPLAPVLAMALAAFFLGGIIKGTMGFGLPILAIPAMTAIHSLPMALSVAVIPVAATNIWQLCSFRTSRGEAPFMPKFLLFGTVGLIFGGATLSLVREAYLEIALGGLVLLYLGQRLGGRASSGLVGTPYFHALCVPRPTFVFCNGAMFTFFSAIQAPTLWFFGLYQPDAIWIGATSLPVAFAGLWIGGWIGARLRAETFSGIVLLILGCTAVVPVVSGLRDILLN